MTTSPPSTSTLVLRARTAVASVFILSGLAIASWFARIPQVRDQLELTPGQLGQVLLIGAIGAVASLPLAGLVVGRFGTARTAAAGGLAASVGLALVAYGAGPLESPAVVAVGLVALGYGMGTWDVAMNVEGAAVERRLGRSLMPRLHAGFSLGTVAGAVLGALADAAGLPVAVHLGLVAIATAAVTLAAIRFFLPSPGHTPTRPEAAVPAPRAGGGRSRLRMAWREPRTLLIGVLLLASALSEGVASDWLAVGLVDGFGASNALGAIGYAVFVAAMTLGRIWGTTALDRWGRVRSLRASGALVLAGVLLVVFGGWLPVAVVGAAIWGVGAALGFPVGMSAAADDPAHSAVRVSVVSSIGYTAFLAGPPLLGWLGDSWGTHQALLVVLGSGVVTVLIASATRPLARTREEDGAEPATGPPVAAAAPAAEE